MQRPTDENTIRSGTSKSFLANAKATRKVTMKGRRKIENAGAKLKNTEATKLKHA